MKLNLEKPVVFFDIESTGLNIPTDSIKDEPKFWEIVDEVVEWLKDSELGGYNSQKFDLPMLAEEIERTRCYRHKSFDLDLHSKKMIDAQLIYFAYEPRNLKAAHRFYPARALRSFFSTGKPLSGSTVEYLSSCASTTSTVASTSASAACAFSKSQPQ